jgi:HSP20 family protein
MNATALARVERWDPVRELEAVTDRVNRIFNRFPVRSETNREALTVADWMPSVDIAEDDKEYLIKAEIPEVDKKDVKVTLQDNVLTIQGERKQETEHNGKRYHRVERSYGMFSRAFTLPEDAAEDTTKAEFKDGMLTVHVPKSARPKPKAMEVKVM